MTVLDKQGLWPGRRCRGAEGATQLMWAEERAMIAAGHQLVAPNLLR